VFYALVGANSNPELLEVEKEVALRETRHWNPIMMNAVLFGRISKLYEARKIMRLTPEQRRLLERTWTRFHRAGAGLSEEAKTRMAELNERLSHLSTEFSHHLLADEQGFTLSSAPTTVTACRPSFVAAARSGRRRAQSA